MKTNLKFIVIGLIIFSLFIFSLSFGQNPPGQANSSPKASYWPSKVRLFAGGASHGRGIYYIDYLVPLYYSKDKDNLLFFNPKERLATPFEEETNLGLGLRNAFNDNFILGINYFYDKNYSINDKLYSQNGFGLEFLSQPLDLRFNYYKPITGAKVVDTNYGFGSDSLLEIYNMEEPLEGFDFEFGGPVFDRYTKTKVYFGAFFYNSKLSKDLRGERFRTETNLNSWLSIDNILERSKNGKLNVTSGLRATIPFELGRVRSGGSPLRAAPLTSYIEDRLFERVVRDLDVRAPSSNQTSKAHDLTYVDNSNTNPSPNGTLNNPYPTIQEGVDNAFGDKWVYVKEGLSNTTSPYAADIILTDNIILWGSGHNGGFKGLITSGIHPVIDGGTDAVTIQNNNTVMGLQIQNAANDGIKFTNGTTLTGTIQYNTIINNGYDGIDLSGNTASMSNFSICGNTVNGNGPSGYYYGIGRGIDLSSNAAAMSDFSICGNTVNGNGSNNYYYANGNGIDLSNNSGTMSGFTISGNTANGNGSITGYYGTYGIGDGIGLSNNHGSMSDFSICGNTVNGNGPSGLGGIGNGIDLIYNSGTMSGFTISGNTANGNGYDGINLSNSHGPTILGFTISGNTVNGNANDGIEVSFNFGGTISDFAISGNTANENGREGINLAWNLGTISGFVISSNTVNGNGTTGIGNSNNSGIDLTFNFGTMSDFTITGNTFNGNINDGIDLRNNQAGASMSSFTISGNTANSNEMTGIDLSYNSGSISEFTFLHNTVTANYQDGIILSNDGGSMSGINLGNGIAGGYNSIYGNNLSDGYFDLYNASGIIIPAQFNWWGQAGGPVLGQIYNSGDSSVDSSNPLSSNPN